MEEQKNSSVENISHKHDPHNWPKKLWQYYPINYDPNLYHKNTSWWMDKIPSLGNTIIEIGCWSALALIWLKINYPEKDIVGIDVNPTIVHMARTRVFYLLQDIPIYWGDALDLHGIPDQSKDIAFSDGLVEHFDEPERIKILKEQLRIAKNVLVIVPTKEGYVANTGYGDERWENKSYWHNFMDKYFIISDEFENVDHYGCVINGIK